jgi:hypothetical protein
MISRPFVPGRRPLPSASPLRILTPRGWAILALAAATASACAAVVTGAV